MNKVFLIDKPEGWTSFDVVAKVRNELRKQSTINNQQSNSDALTANCQLPTTKIKVGHAGTLDPFATGLLIVLVGAETKNQDKYMKKDKEYEATLKLGFMSTTGDPEGAITPYCHSELTKSDDPDEPAYRTPSGNLGLDPSCGQDDNLVLGDIERVLKQFTGEIEQIPPIYSAIKIDGKRAYKLAREGKTPIMKSRSVMIHELSIINYQFPILKIRVKCSSGTYIRTLAEDIGKSLGTGAYLTELRRTKIGEYDVKDALSVKEALTSLREMKQSPPTL